MSQFLNPSATNLFICQNLCDGARTDAAAADARGHHSAYSMSRPRADPLSVTPIQVHLVAGEFYYLSITIIS